MTPTPAALLACAACAGSPHPGDASIPDAPAAALLAPEIDGDWWRVAATPDLGAPLDNPGEQPVDFAIWRSADGAWHIWSCIRFTSCGGQSRLFFHWRGASLTDTLWSPVGVAMQADTSVGETECGLQAPYVFYAEGAYQLFYGDWEHICRAQSADGQVFARVLNAGGGSSLFSEGAGENTRDPMVIRVGDVYHAYYTAIAGGRGAVYARTSTDLRSWSASRIVAAGGAAGDGPSSSECPFVVYLPEAGAYYLFRTQRYGQDAQTTVYRSSDPFDFGVNDDRFRLGTLPIAAPEVFESAGQWYVAALEPALDGIRIARLRWTPR